MTNKLQLYKCKICGNVIQVLLDGEGELVCCNEPMELLTANNQELGTGEYHIPVYLKDDNNETYIQVGKDQHPMTEEHHIEFIERISKDKNYLTLKYLNIGEEPKIKIDNIYENECAIEYCNIHGLWKGENNVEF